MNRLALAAAFCATVYRVEVPGQLPDQCFALRIGRNDPAFDDFLRGQGVSRWGILTACNPQAKRLSKDENQARQAQLIRRLDELGWRYFAACNLADGDSWPAEPGCLILQVNEEALRTLAAEFSQLAVICGDAGSAPRLLWV